MVVINFLLFRLDFIIALKKDNFVKKTYNMSTLELRHIITQYLSLIDDASFLGALKTIVESKVSEGTYELSDYQKKRLEHGRAQLRSGKTISNESLKQEMNQWLSSK
jgi:hypothetical protein